MQKAIRGWLSPPDPWKNHHIARESRHETTAAWFVQGATFLKWRSSGPSSLLWIHGKRQLPPSRYAFAETDKYYLSFVAGAGKSVLWYVNFRYFVMRTYGVCQFYRHRGDRGYAKVWTRITGVLLPRFSGRSKEGPPWVAVILAGPTLSSIRLLL